MKARRFSLSSLRRWFSLHVSMERKSRRRKSSKKRGRRRVLTTKGQSVDPVPRKKRGGGEGIEIRCLHGGGSREKRLSLSLVRVCSVVSSFFGCIRPRKFMISLPFFFCAFLLAPLCAPEKRNGEARIMKWAEGRRQRSLRGIERDWTNRKRRARSMYPLHPTG